jgi:hypothetical protein
VWGGVEEIPGSSRDNTVYYATWSLVYFAPLRLFRHSSIQRPRLVGKCSRRCARGGPPKEAPPADSEANSEGLTPRRGQKPVKACEGALAAALAPFLLRVASSGRFWAKRGGSSSRDRDDISPETGFPPPLPLQSVNFPVVS